MQNGIMLKNTTSETYTKYYKGICTSESTSDKPYITVKYFYNGVKGARNEPYTYEPISGQSRCRKVIVWCSF